MTSYFRFNGIPPKEDEFVNIVAVLATDPTIKTYRDGDDKIHREFTFYVVQEESIAVPVKYVSSSQNFELKLMKLVTKEGTILVMNNLIVSRANPLQLELIADDELCVLAVRPNKYQIDRFLKVLKNILKNCKNIVHKNLIYFDILITDTIILN